MVNYAKKEFDILIKNMSLTEKPNDIEVVKLIRNNLLEVLEAIEKQDHSDFSIHMLISILKRLALFLPLTNLQGTDDEWIEIRKELFQNVRCSRIFKDANGAYDSEYYVYKDGTGYYITSDSKKYIEFPYFPSDPIIVDRV